MSCSSPLLPGEIGAALSTAATDAFTTALAWTGGIAVLILLAVAIFADIILRGVSAQADLAEADHKDLEREPERSRVLVRCHCSWIGAIR